MLERPSILNVHTPSSSFSITHSLLQESLHDLYNKLSRKPNTDYYGDRVGPGWLKYEYNDAIWNLDDESDYTIFVWRSQQQEHDDSSQTTQGDSLASTSQLLLPPPDVARHTMPTPPTLHLWNPHKPLPTPPAYLNPSYYMFRPSRAQPTPSRQSPVPSKLSAGRRSKMGKSSFGDDSDDDGVPKFKKQFERFHSENGVRTVMGSIGPVQNVRMLLKSGYRHVYISRKFAVKHGFIPSDAAPGNYGYGGLVNIGSWPVTLTPSLSQPNRLPAGYQRPDAFSHPSIGSSHTQHSSPNIPHSTTSKRSRARQVGAPASHPSTVKAKEVMVQVYLSEEPHFDVVLGRSFFEKRQVRTNGVDPTDVVCLDTGEKIECELVILKDGRGEIVTVT
ncbi:hypothetical protein BJ165DRAFT_1339604 [Panaeolus papilionaceus]|nr:hypothetical protein BJ165DRAFT_1339604 [Panaeolus papilionaceus]